MSKLEKIVRFFKRQKYLIDYDTHVCHTVSKINNNCNHPEDDDSEFVNEVRHRNALTYDYYCDCPYCCKKTESEKHEKRSFN